MPPIENARGFKGDKEIVRIERERNANGDLVEFQYNKDGYCLVAKIVMGDDDEQ